MIYKEKIVFVLFRGSLNYSLSIEKPEVHSETLTCHKIKNLFPTYHRKKHQNPSMFSKLRSKY